MRKLFVAVGLALGSGSALAADFGIGITARSDDGYLYAPINLSKAFRLEPSIRYGTSELSFTDDGDVDSQEIETWEFGLGLFGLKQITDAAHLYYGARVAYVDSENTTIQPLSFGDVLVSETTQDGYRIGPTLGFEYLFGGHFSIGGEVSYTFLDVDGESTGRIGDSVLPTIETEQKSSATQTRLIFRYMF